MNHRLSDTERTLLSGYLDGEASNAEQQVAEGLLARSKDAQAYLNDLRSLRNVAHEAFPPIISTAITGATFSAKLTGNSIANAVGKTAVGKGLFAGSWGIAGIATAAASIGVVMALNFGGGRIDNSGSNLRPVIATQTASINPLVAADTGNLVVPSMTPDELVGFAVKGTLPIDQNRNRYLTVQTEGKDSFRLELHRSKPKELATQLQQVNLAETPQLDTVEQAIRRSIKALPNGNIGLCNDIWSNRLRLVNLLRTRNLRPDLDSRLATEHRRLAEFRAARIAQVEQFQQQIQAVQVNMSQQGWNGHININGTVGSLVVNTPEQAWNVWEQTTFPVVIQPDAFPQTTETVAFTVGCSNNPALLQEDNVVVDLFNSPVFEELQSSLPAEMVALLNNSEPITTMPTQGTPVVLPVKTAAKSHYRNNKGVIQNRELSNGEPFSIQVLRAPNQVDPDQNRQVVIIRTQEILEHARQQLQRADSLLRQLQQQSPNQPENSNKQP